MASVQALCAEIIASVQWTRVCKYARDQFTKYIYKSWPETAAQRTSSTLPRVEQPKAVKKRSSKILNVKAVATVRNMVGHQRTVLSKVQKLSSIQQLAKRKIRQQVKRALLVEERHESRVSCSLHRWNMPSWTEFEPRGIKRRHEESFLRPQESARPSKRVKVDSSKSSKRRRQTQRPPVTTRTRSLRAQKVTIRCTLGQLQSMKATMPENLAECVALVKQSAQQYDLSSVGIQAGQISSLEYMEYEPTFTVELGAPEQYPSNLLTSFANSEDTASMDPVDGFDGLRISHNGAGMAATYQNTEATTSGQLSSVARDEGFLRETTTQPEGSVQLTTQIPLARSTKAVPRPQGARAPISFAIV